MSLNALAFPMLPSSMAPTVGTLRRLSLAALALGFCGSVAAAEETARATVNVTAVVTARTSLKVSSQILQFDVARADGVATAAVDFTAGARLPSGSEIVLTVEPLRGVDGPGGAADIETSLSFAGEGQGLLAGQIRAAQMAIVGRWQGSGVRDGRVIFTLRASTAGTYSVPVRFILSTP